MLIRLTMSELKHLALKQLNLETYLEHHSSGLIVHETPHTIELVGREPDGAPAYAPAYIPGIHIEPFFKPGEIPQPSCEIENPLEGCMLTGSTLRVPV